MTFFEQVKRCLCDANMALDADDDDLSCLTTKLLESIADLWHKHREGALVDVSVCLDTVWAIEAKLAACLSKFGSELGCCEYGNVEDPAGFE